MLVTIGEIIKRFRTEGACVKFSPETIVHMANVIGYTKRRIGGKVGYDKSLITAISQRFKEAVEYEKGLGMKKAQKSLKQPQMQPRQLDYVGYNGERDNVDYEWEKDESIIKENNMDNLTILWLDDQRDPYKYLNTKSTSTTFARNKQFYDNLLKQYNVNFVWVKNLYQFIDYIEKNGVPQFVSFDHDLNNRGGGEGLNDEQKLNNNGVNCAKWLVNYCKKMGQSLPKFYVHSANPKHGPEINRVLTSENKQIITLTESDLHKIIKESVYTILKGKYDFIY